MAKSGKIKLSFGLGIMLAALGMVFIFNDWLLPVKADPVDSVQGWGWSDVVGWISMNCDNPEISVPCDQTNYGVNANLITGEITGYAWSQHVGWISFESADLVGCPNAPCEARVDWVTHEVSGWAKVLSYGGWISLRDPTPDGTPYGVTYNEATEEFEGWAFESAVMGWISFNCNNRGVCSSSTGEGGPSDYQVIKKATVGAPPVADFVYCRETTGAVSFFDTSTDPDGPITQWYWDFDDGSPADENQYPPPHSFVGSPPYNVSLTIVDDGFNVVNVSKSITPATAPSCEFFVTNVAATACDLIGVEWDEAFGAEQYEIYRRNLTAGEVSFTLMDTVDTQPYGIYCSDFAGDGGVTLETCSWTDNTGLPERDYEYYVRALRFNSTQINNSTENPYPACTGDALSICPVLETTPACIATNLNTTASCEQNVFNWDTVASAIGHNVYMSNDATLPATNIIASTFPADYCSSNCFDLGASTSYTHTEVLSNVPYYYSAEVIVDDGEGNHIVGPQVENSLGIPRCYRGPTYIEQ